MGKINIPPPTDRYITISIVNTGDRPMTIEKIGLKPFHANGWELPSPEKMEGKGSLPATLQHGEKIELWFRISPTVSSNWLPSFARECLLNWPRLRLLTLRVVFVTTLGAKFRSRMDKGSKLAIKEAIVHAKKQVTYEREQASA